MPSRHTRTRIIISAPPEAVWAALLELAGGAPWSPGLRLRPWTGTALHEGNGAWLNIVLFGLPLRVPVRVEAASPHRLCWIGGPPGLFRGRHFFELRKIDGGTELIHGEDFSGFALPLLWSWMQPELDRMYRAFNEALASYVGGEGSAFDP
jgi:hypothetical protein